MSLVNFRRGIAVLVLGVVLGAPLVSSAEPRAAGWSTGLWAFLARAWAKNGCRIDPNGRCLDGLQAPADNGCGVDPNGLGAKNGCRVDPDGLSAKNGCHVDPNGLCAPRP